MTYKKYMGEKVSHGPFTVQVVTGQSIVRNSFDDELSPEELASEKFTKGPWVYVGCNREGEEISIDGHFRQGDEISIEEFNGECVCRIHCDGAWDDNMWPTIKANANLIAAAPELYENLKALVDVCENLGVTGGNIEDAKSALAEARGEEPT